MYRMILATQWKWSRVMVLLASVLAFALPLVSLQAANDARDAIGFIHTMQLFGIGYSMLAAGIGLMLALQAWTPDARGRHVYALTLPVSRARYVLMRMGAGLSFLFPVALALLLGALLVTAIGSIPAGLTTYPLTLTLRFLLAGAVAFILVFAIGVATQRTAGIVLGIIVAAFLLQYVITLVEVDVNILEMAVKFLFESPGVLSVFTGRWGLVDA